MATKGLVAAIILAAGQGTRFGGRIRKQYLQLHRRPIVWWSLVAFNQSPLIDRMVLVVPESDYSRLRRQSAQWGVSKLCAVVRGGAQRADSVREGLKALPPATRWIAVHDAVRPLVTPTLIESVVKDAFQYHAAILACPSKDTIKLADSRQRVQSSPPRENVWLAQTPQVFERQLLEKAHRQGHHLAVTDDAQLVERLGVHVKLTLSSYDNIKVTIPSDLILARSILRNR